MKDSVVEVVDENSINIYVFCGVRHAMFVWCQKQQEVDYANYNVNDGNEIINIHFSLRSNETERDGFLMSFENQLAVELSKVGLTSNEDKLLNEKGGK